MGRAPSPASSVQQDERLALDWKTLEYHPRQKPKFPALDMAKNIEDTGARLRTLLGLDGAPQKADKAGAFLWAALSDLWTYSANRVPEISDSIVEIDRAMRLGFNWELGPFELWDAAGVEATVARMKKKASLSPPTQSACSPPAKNPGTSTIHNLRQEKSIGNWEPKAGNRCKSPQEFGRSPSQKNLTEWSRKIPAPLSSTWATAWPASSSTAR